MYRIIFIMLVMAGYTSMNVVGANSMTVCRPVDLKCEHLVDPLGIDITQPRLSWRIEDSRRGSRQTAYRVWVAGSPEILNQDKADLWDSGKIESDKTIEIHYQGQLLDSRQSCFWKVRVWDQEGKSRDSQIAQWEMGLLNTSDWQAKWIGRTTDINDMAAPLLRRNLTIESPIKQARLYITGLGYFECYINGKRVGDHLLDPGYTRYDRRVLYLTHDVTDLLQQGDNAIGVILGNGWFNVSNKAAWDFDKALWRAAPQMLCQIEVELENGRHMIVPGDESWKTAQSPIVYNTIYSGEIYDARLEQPGWHMPGFDDAKWSAAQLVEPPGGKLSAQMMSPIRADRELKPVKISEPKPGVYVFDFGQNMAGHARLRVSGPAGTKVSMKYGEQLGDDGSVNQYNIARHVHRFDPNQIFQTDTYIAKGDGVETWHSRFSYYGFQYVEVTGLPSMPTPETLTAVFFHSDVPKTGKFTCSNPLINRIWQATWWSYLSNMHGIFTDCPHREKNGWTADAHLGAEMGMFNTFAATVYTKWINDITDEQQPDGRLPGIVPTSGWGYDWGNGPPGTVPYC